MKNIRARLDRLYGPAAENCFAKLSKVIEQFNDVAQPQPQAQWDQRDVVLITYGDQVQTEGEPPLATLRKFLVAHQLDNLIHTVHILPFCPYSSDDGFSVIDYRAVDPSLGDWSDVNELGESFDLMFDLVLNHCSSRSRWFQDFLAGKAPFDEYFIEEDPSTDLSAITRPRSSPVLTEFTTNRGTKHVWSTFSDDQVDLNFANPDVLVEMLATFLFYLQQGAAIIRLDAIAYLWKQVGTDCIHLPETHEVVRLFRDVIDAVAPHVLLLTETNVPHAENISYFGDGDEAHLVYQFSLPPLLLDAMVSSDARPLVKWLSELPPTKSGTSFFNFTASHDGIGVRPLEGLVSAERIARLVDAVETRGGMVSMRKQPDGTDSPYELNISYFSALGDSHEESSVLHVRRFLTTQGTMLSLRGMPAIYFHSLFGTPNDVAAAQTSGHPRRINRRKFQLDELETSLSELDSIPAAVFDGVRHLLSVRVKQPAFHPDASQRILRLDDPALVAFLRTSLDQAQEILVVANVSDCEKQLDVAKLTNLEFRIDLLTGLSCDSAHSVFIEPFGLRWLSK